MICPLLHHKDHDPDVFPGETYPDCLAGECAWWDSHNSQCTWRTLTLVLEMTEETLSQYHKRD